MTSKIKNRTSGLFTAQGYLSDVQECAAVLKDPEKLEPCFLCAASLPTLLAPLSQTHGDFYLHLLNTSRTVIN